MGEHTEEEKDKLSSIYYNLRHPAAYSTVEKLYNAVERSIPKSTIKEWLRGELAYTLHKPRRINFKRNHYEVYTINELFQADLIDVQSMSAENDGYKYILLVIDCFSRYIWTRPLKSKCAREVLDAFKSIFNSNKMPPTTIVTDRGREFFAQLISNYFKKLEINHYAPSSDTFKAAFAER